WKYKLLDSVADPVGLALYGEWGLGFDEAELEAKVIVDKRLGDVLLATNLVVENEWESGGRDLHLQGTAGVTYFVSDALAVGLEGLSDSIFSTEGFEHTTLLAGPVISYAGGRWWAAFS